MIQSMTQFFELTGFASLSWQMMAMWLVVLLLFYLAIYRRFEPLLLVPIAFGALVANLPTRGIITLDQQPGSSHASGVIHVEATVVSQAAAEEDDANSLKSVTIHRIEGGLFDILTQGVKMELFPPLIFLGVGALTDFGPLIANPRVLLLGAAAQLGVFFHFSRGFSPWV
jgi:Na+-transporting methylmalonyl-CoA/oxaloacetate decarboxylase beta subunit